MIERALGRKFKSPYHFLSDENEDMIIFQYPRFVDDDPNAMTQLRKEHAFLKEQIKTERDAGFIGAFWINDYVYSMKD